MQADEKLLLSAKQQVETKLGWGDSLGWSNQDFLELSKRIQDETGVSISHVTLKRIWGKVKYESLPNNYTLSTLVKFIGYENWREFKIGNTGLVTKPASGNLSGHNITIVPHSKRRSVITAAAVVIVAGLVAIITFAVIPAKKKVDPVDYAFSSRAILSKGIPNSVIFNLDATKAPSDSVIIQQSWDSTLRTKVSKNDRQHTLLYYFPGYFKPKLIVNNQIVKEHDLLVRSDGWFVAVQTSPVPVYFKATDAIANGRMFLPAEKIKAQNIPLTPQAPSVFYSNVKDFGAIYSDDFIFETALKNEYKDGSAACQLTNIYLLCEGTAIGIPLCAKGCISGIDLMFAGFGVSGKQEDLSGFGVDFDNFIKVRIESKNGKAVIFLNDKQVYRVDRGIEKAKIVGIDFLFQGTGSVDYVKLYNESASFEDDF